MGGRTVDGLREACRGPIALTIVVGTEVRASLADFLRNFLLRQARIVTFGFACDPRTGRPTTCSRLFSRLQRKPIGCPFPYVSNHVVQTKSVRRKRANGGCPV